jgi:alpha-amylase
LTALDPNFGTEADLKELVEKAQTRHQNSLDAVINHTGPTTDIDETYPMTWARTEPQCKYDNFENTTACTLVANLPDILTESNEKLACQLY